MTMRSLKFRLLLACAVALPLVLYAVIAARLSWRPRILHYDTAVVSIVYSPDGQWLACASRNKVELRHADTLRTVWSQSDNDESLRAVAFTPDSHSILISHTDVLEMWQVQPLRRLRTFSDSNGRTALLVMPDGSAVVTGGEERPSELLNLHSGKIVRQIAAWQEGEPVALAPSGATLALLNYTSDSGLRLWSATTRRQRAFLLPGDAINCATFLPASNTVVAGTSSGKTIFWNVKTGTVLRTVNSANGEMHCLAVSPDGKLLACGFNKGLVNILQAGDGSLLRTLDTHAGLIYSLAFSTDSTTLAVACQNNDVQLWRVK